MKAIANKFLVTILCLLGVLDTFAIPKPPSPGGKKFPPPPPGLPIDENLYTVFVLALLFGVYTIYKHQSKSKKTV